MEFKEEMVSQETVYEGVIVNVRRDKARLMDGRITNREVVEHPGGVAVFAMDDQGRVALVRQYRYPMGEETLELPAGKLEPGEDPRDSGLRELAEETGLEPEEIAAAEEANLPVASLQMETGDGFTLESVLGTEGMEEAIVEREALRGAVAALPERERQVILLRYFRGMTQDRTAKVLGVSQVQVSRIERKAVEHLRRKLE